MKNTKIVVLKKNKNILNKKISETDNLGEILNSLTDKRFKMTEIPCLLYSYSIDNSRLDVWGYTDGKPGQENHHDLPPGAESYVEFFNKSDTDLLFADLFVLKYNNDTLEDLSIEDYAKYYTELLGGIEDLGETDSYSSEEEPTQEDLDFIVNDDDELSTDDSWVPEENETFEAEIVDYETDSETVTESETE